MLWKEQPLTPPVKKNLTLEETATMGLALNMETTHTCRNWDAIHEWASKRQFGYEMRTDLVQGGGNARIID